MPDMVLRRRFRFHKDKNYRKNASTEMAGTQGPATPEEGRSAAHFPLARDGEPVASLSRLWPAQVQMPCPPPRGPRGAVPRQKAPLCVTFRKGYRWNSEHGVCPLKLPRRVPAHLSEWQRPPPSRWRDKLRFAPLILPLLLPKTGLTLPASLAFCCPFCILTDGV